MKVKISSSPTHSELEEMDLSLTTRRGAECIIGRSPNSDLVLDSEDVSRQHGKFFYRSGNYYFCDLGSRNGTIINGKLAENNHPYILKNGDIIRIGDFALSLEEDLSLSEQSETVVRIINPSMFSNLQGRENASFSEANTPSSEPVNQPQEVSEPVTNESAEEIAVQTQEENVQEVISQEENLDLDLEESDVEETIQQTQEENVREVISQEENLDLGLEESDVEETIQQTQEENVQEVISQEEDLDSDLEESDLEESDVEKTIEQTQEEDVQQAESEMIEVVSSDDLPLSTETTKEVEEEVVEELVSQTASISTPDVDEESQAVNQETEKDAVENIPEEESFIKVAKILEDKQIVLISHETKKTELKELVAEHEEFLSYCLTVTWQTFSNYLYRETGLKVIQDIPPATSGGYQAINSLINSKEIIALIFLRDLIVPQAGQASEEALLRTCNINNILLATNLPTAQAVVHFLKNMKDS